MKQFIKHIILFITVTLFFNFSIFAVTKQDSQVIPSGHWLYNDLTTLSSEVKSTFYLETQPKTVGEIKLYLYSIDYESLSKAGKAVYKRVNDFIDDSDNYLRADYARFYINLQLNPEFYYKTNKNIDWTFTSKVNDYAITFPIILGFSDFITIETDPILTANKVKIADPYNFTNIPYAGNRMDFYLPKTAYISFAKMFDHWGLSFHIGREGMQIGQTSMDSIIYSRNFETDMYSQFSLFNKYIKYTLNVNQLQKDKYLYLHELTLHPFKNFTVGCVEGSLLNAPFELRYLNPLMFMHQFASWYQYDDYPNQETGEIYDLYGEGRFCAFLGFTADFIPMKNMRIYGLYGQNEILDAGGSRTDSALSVPDSIAAQLGITYDFPLSNEGYLKTGIEALYTSPFYMVKHSPDWSLYRTRHDIQSGGLVHTWMGTPFGPDNFSVQAKALYEPNDKWSVGANVLFSIKGENNYDTLFSDQQKHYIYTDKYGKEINLLKDDSIIDDKGNFRVNEDGLLINQNGDVIKDSKQQEIPINSITTKWYWDYYPSVKYQQGHTEYKDIARNMWMHGDNPEYKTQIGVNGHYKILENLDVSAQINYSVILNSNHEKDKIDQGFEFAIGVKYNLFK